MWYEMSDTMLNIRTSKLVKAQVKAQGTTYITEKYRICIPCLVMFLIETLVLRLYFKL